MSGSPHIQAREVENSFHLKQFLTQFIWRYWYIYAALPILALVIAFLYLRYEQPTYRVQSTMLIKSNPGKEDINEDLVFQDLGIESIRRNLQNEIQIMKSLTFMKQVIDTLKIDRAFFLEGRVRNTELYASSPIEIDTAILESDAYEDVLRIEPIDQYTFSFGVEDNMKEYRFGENFQTRWGLFRFSYDPFSKSSGKQLILRFYRPESLAAQMSAGIQIRPIGQSDVLLITYSNPNAQKAIDIVNTLFSVYNEETIKDKNQIAENTLKFVEERLDFLDGELSVVEQSEVNYKQQAEIPAGLDAAVGDVMEKMDTYEGEIEALNIELSLLESLESRLRDNEKPFDLLPAGLFSDQPVLEENIDRVNGLILERDGKLQDATSNNPVVRDLENQIRSMREGLLSDLIIAKRRTETRKQDKTDHLDRLYSRIQQTPVREKELRGIARQQNIKESLYLYLLQKQEETALSMAVTTSNAKVIDEARLVAQIRANPMSVYGMGFGGGLLFALALVVFIEALNDKVRDEEDIKRGTSAPLIGYIAKNNKSDEIVVKAGSKSSIAEMFRLLRTNLQYLRNGETAATFLLTSIGGGEGKTFTTVNLGMAMALANKRTIVVGMDLRKPKLAGYFDKKDKFNGLSSYIVGQQKLEDIIMPSGLHEKLDFIPSGPIPPNPSELLLNEKVEQLFAFLKEEYDTILIDSPPFTMVTDAFILDRYTDASLVIIRAAVTPKNAIKIIEEARQAKKLKNTAIIFNGLNLKKQYGYQYGYGYGYYE